MTSDEKRKRINTERKAQLRRERKDFVHTSKTYDAIATLRMELEYGLREEIAA